MSVRQRPRPDRQAQRPAGDLAKAAWTRFCALDRQVIAFFDRVSPIALRVSLGVVFIWFGALKVGQVSPVAELVAGVVPVVDPSWFVPALGVLEVAVGLGLVVGRGMRLMLALFAAQMTGTLLVLVIRPDVAFQDGNLLLLTTEGEFVIKNLVLLSAGLAVGARLRRPRPWSAPSPLAQGGGQDAAGSGS